jgi:hypothetical protein
MQSFSASKGDGIADLERQLVIWMKPVATNELPDQEQSTAVAADTLGEASGSIIEPNSPNQA